MVGVSRMGRLYYKGISQARTQELSRQISDEFIGQIQFGKGNISPTSITTGNGGVAVIFCIGDSKYRLVPNRQLDTIDDAAQRKSTQVLQKKSNVSGCNVSTDDFSSTDTELASQGMRISRFRVTSTSNGLWSFDMQITFGDEEFIRYTDTTATADTPAQYETAYCTSGVAGSELCATSSIRTTIQRRLAYTGWMDQL